jgi:hypothetical protein
MPGSIENPRRAPRAPIRCEARVALREGGFWSGPTTDYGPRGCQLESPSRLEPGSRLFLQLWNERVQEPRALSGRIAWSSTSAPWRCGVAFDDGAAATAGAFFERLAAAYPGIDTFGRAPDRIAEDAPLRPAPPPAGVDPLLLAQEVIVLRAAGAGLTAAALRDALGAAWPGCLNPFFALVGRGYLTIGPPDAAAAAAWAPLLARAPAAS